MYSQVDNRSIEQLQSKYKELKKLARKATSNMKRDLVETGNKKLRSSTVREMQSSTALLALRSNMGPSATGFESKHCSDSTSKTGTFLCSF